MSARIDRPWLERKLDELDLLVGSGSDTDARLDTWGVDRLGLTEIASDFAAGLVEGAAEMLTDAGHIQARAELGPSYVAIIAAAACFTAGFEVGYLAALDADHEEQT